MPRLKITKHEVELMRKRIWCLSELTEGISESFYSQSPRHSLERLSNQILSNAIGEVTNRRNSVNVSYKDRNHSGPNSTFALSSNRTSMKLDEIITAK